MTQTSTTIPRHDHFDALRHHFPVAPDRKAILAPGRPSLTFDGLVRLIEDTIHSLRRQGIARRDRVAVVLPNGPEMATVFLGVASAAACAPLNPAYSLKEYLFYLEDLDARALITAEGLDTPARTAAGQLGIPVIDLHTTARMPAGSFTLNGTAGNASAPATAATPDDIALVLHTSGTTSRPKIVPLSHRNLLQSAHNVGRSLELGPDDRCLNIMPLFHIHGLVAALLASLNAHAAVVCTPGFSAADFPDWLSEFTPTWYTAVPTLHQAILALPATGNDAATARLRLIRSSSSSLPPAVMTALEQRFGVPVIEAYGMTEAAHQMSSNPLPPRERKPGSVGLSAGPEVAIMDTGGRLLPRGDTGEVVIRGPNVTSGYSSNPEANAAAFTDGWFRTGDEGYFDQEGYLFLTGRLKEMINRGGQKISPREIDDTLLDHPGVRQAVTFAIPHPRLGEGVGAAVVARTGADLDPRELRRWCGQRLAPYKVPQQIIMVDEIPKGPTGKLQRIGLADRLAHLLVPENTPPTGDMEELLAGIWSELLATDVTSRQANFFALGGDSLLATQTAARLGRELGRDLPVRILFDYPVLADLADMLGTSGQGTTPRDLEALLADVEALSDDEAEHLLGNEHQDTD